MSVHILTIKIGFCLQCDQESLYERAKIDKFCADQGFIGWFETSAKENMGLEKAVNFLLNKASN